MNYQLDYDEVYDNVDGLFSEFKENILSCVKDEIMDEVKRLRSENEELRTITREVDSIKMNLEIEKKQLEAEREGLMSRFNAEKIEDVLASLPVNGFTAGISYEQPPKCDKCNKNRMIEYKTPRGYTQYEACVCATEYRRLYPKKVRLVRVSMRKAHEYYEEDRGIKATATYFCECDSTELRLALPAKSVEEAMLKCNVSGFYVYGSNDPIVFEREEDCKSFCDQLTDKEKEKIEKVLAQWE